MHANRQVREEAKSRLESIDGFIQLSTNQGWNLRVDRMPAAVIGTQTDSVEQTTKDWGDGRPAERRMITLSVDIVDDGEKETLDDDLDALRAQVESQIGADDDFGGLAGFIEHTGAEMALATDDEGDRWFAFYVLTWEIEVWTEVGNPEVVL